MTEVFETLLLAAHLLCVNVAAGGPIIAAWLDWRASRGDDTEAWSARSLAAWSVGGLIIGGALGVLLGWLKWDDAYRALWVGPLNYKAWWAGIEWVFSLLLMLAWWWWLPRVGSVSRAAAATRATLAILAATNLLYHFPMLFTVAARLSDAGQTTGQPMRGAGFREQMLLAETPAVTIHVVLASVAVAGTMLIGLALRRRRQGHPEDSARLAVWGGRWALIPSLIQLPVGVWTLLTLPAPSQNAIMGYSTFGTLLLVGSLAAAFWLLRELVNVSLGDTTRAVLVRAMAAMLVTVVLMTGLLQVSRTARLTRAADASTANTHADLILGLQARHYEARHGRLRPRATQSGSQKIAHNKVSHR